MKDVTISELLEDMRNCTLIKEKHLDNGISSFNFTRDAFFNKEWNNLTTHARGLYIDTTVPRIKARSYDKFFHVGETPETDLEFIMDTWHYPIDIYVKENGYLGICSWNEDGTLFCASKSTNEGEYADRFRELLTNTLRNNDNYALFWKTLHDEDLSAVFEVIDPENDPHIIEYEEPQLILLDLVYNSFYDEFYLDFWNKSYEVLEMVGKSRGLQYKERVCRIWTAAEFNVWYKDVTSVGYKYNDKYVEGFVIEGCGGNEMAKVKTEYYNYWKWLRQLSIPISQGKNVKNLDKFSSKEHPELVAILEYMYHMMPLYYEMNNEYMDIITFRNAFYENRGNT